MEERDLELDDDGKIKLKKTAEGEALAEETDSGDEIVLNVPDFSGFSEEEPSAEVQAEQTLRAREEERDKRRERAEALLAEAEALLAKGEYDAAGEKFLDSAALYGADWRPWFGVVRVQTKELTDFSEIYDCEQAYDKALRRMSREDRAALAAKYAPGIDAQADALREESERAAREDARLREERLPAAKREFAASVKRFIGAGASLLLCLAIAVVLWCSITAVAGSGILIGAIACTVLAAVFLVFTALATKRFVLARTALSACTVPGKTEEGRHAAALAEEEALLRSVAEDLRK